MSLLCLGVLAGLLVIGALSDIDCRRLPNWLTAAIAALYGLFVAVSPTPIDWMSAIVVASLVFALGFACFAFNLMGGGDVKLMTGLALWAGAEHITLFLIITSLAGGVLSIVMLTLRKWAASPMVLALSVLSAPIVKKLLGPAVVAGVQSPATMAEDPSKDFLPYGVAIAAGGFFVIYALLQL